MDSRMDHEAQKVTMELPFGPEPFREGFLE